MDKPIHMTLSEAIAEGTKLHYERRAKSLWHKYADSEIKGDVMALAGFLDAVLLQARERYYLQGHSWKASFLGVFQFVTEKPEAERPAAIAELMEVYGPAGRANEILKKLVDPSSWAPGLRYRH